jgi:beta-glucosidase
MADDHPQCSRLILNKDAPRLLTRDGLEKDRRFLPEFLFGAATSACQIEGAWKTDGKGESIWDRFCHTPGKIRFGHTADVACNHYHLYRDDVALMKHLGLNAYRFSIAWPRVLPSGQGPVNEKGLDFYKSLVEILLQNGIRPFITLFHWDLPQILQSRLGGFRSRECAKLFADFAYTMARQLGDTVFDWITINEPWTYAVPGELGGVHAPGRRNPWGAFQTMHNLLVAHGLGVQALKAVRSDLRTGAALNLMPIYPRGPSRKDKDAALIADEFYNRIQLDPLFKGTYPRALLRRLRWFAPNIEADDMDIITTRSDFLGVNAYAIAHAYHKWYIPFFHAWMTGAQVGTVEYAADGLEHTSMGWPVWPRGIYEVLTRIRSEYANPPVYITENGAAFDDFIENGSVHDFKRVEYLRHHLHMVHQAMKEGADVRGYFVWSLLDNFEWSMGYSKRFGIVYVDHVSQERTIKDSGLWYSGVIRHNQDPCV